MLRGSTRLLARRSTCAASAAAVVGAFRGRRSVGRSRPVVVSSVTSSSSEKGDPSWLRRDIAIVLVHPQVLTAGGIGSINICFFDIFFFLSHAVFRSLLVSKNPQIPQNTGSAARTAAATRIPLHLVGPLGFDVSNDTKLKRAGLDYWDSVVLKVWPDWTSFLEGVSGNQTAAPPLSPAPRFVAFSKRGNVHFATPGVYGEPTAENPTFLLFGAETTGLPEEAHAAAAAVVRLPIEQRHVRSLNLAVSVGVGAYEALRQIDGVGELPDIG